MDKVESWKDIRGFIPVWPIVRSEDWCGDFSRKPSQPRPLKDRMREILIKQITHGSWY